MWLPQQILPFLLHVERVHHADWCLFFRQLIGEMVVLTHDGVGGPGIEVQVDESKFGKRKCHRGHRIEGVWIFGGVEIADERKCFLVKVPNRNRDTLCALIKKHILPGSIIRSDGHPSYKKLDEILGHCYEHEVVVHDHNLVDPVTGVHTNTIEGTWNGVKINVPVRQPAEKHVIGHLHEFMWRRQNAGRLWEALLDALRSVRHV